VIILSGVLVVLAIALLVTGIITGNTGHPVAGLDGLKLIYVSIGVSIISALCLAIGVFLRRKELFGSAESEASPKRSAVTRSKTARQAKAKARVGAGGETPVPVPAATATDVPAETSVFVVPGRKRYHLETCRQLAGRDKEELTYVEAHEEGFTACTACLPDTALAARAAVTETESATESPAGSEVAEKSRSGVAAEADASTDTATLDEITEITGAPSATERPLARSRSFFKPPARDTATAGEDSPIDLDRAKDASREEDDDVAPPESSDPEQEPSAEVPAESGSPTSDHESPHNGTPATDGMANSDADDTAELGDDPTGEPDRHAAPSAEDEKASQDADHQDATDAAAEGRGLPFVRILSGTKRYHRPDCALIEDIADDADDLEKLSPAEAKKRGCTPCLVCQPDMGPSDGAS
jgi:hypothetical protein